VSPSSRNFRCDDDLWSAAKAATARRGETITDVLVRALRDYVAADEQPRAETPGDPSC
jgi:hypothetical protein